ncbi:histidine--tRNA ligase [Clostridium sp. 'deep sea']|uniref:histidine--tRNA ligase n=1 Tax=Clostridium sp. 'deep sea' TaxID=2779445 RepID=UPI00189698AF|nr:histidine--tRNA ligase [Clostridium sp. 'deep sea']QOR33842.1 histidine--tRNA ligase [Clostridium sp. 'deep sea']
MSKIIKPSILAGFMELMPNEQVKFNDIVSKIVNVYESNGCLAIDTPILEKSEVILAKEGGETEKQVYRFTKGKNDLLMRFDLTVPFARYVAQYIDKLTFPFKRYQIGKVYRGERNQRGRYREFYQLDVDVIAKNKLNINNDAWVISLVSKAFKAIGLQNYCFLVSNRKILKGLFKELNITNIVEVMSLIDKYDKMDKASFNEKLIQLIGVDKVSFINKVLEIKGSAIEVITSLQNLEVNNEEFKTGVNELKQVVVALELFAVDNSEYEINLKIIRGLNYYTGTVFETSLIGNEQYGSVCSGGRYDNLAQNYTKNVLPGVGISIGLTRLFYVLKEIGFIDNYCVDNKTEYLIVPIGDTFKYSCQVMCFLQSKGIATTMYFEDASLKKKLNYANKLNIDKVLLIGEEEQKNNSVKLKNMKLGKETVLNYKELTTNS